MLSNQSIQKHQERCGLCVAERKLEEGRRRDGPLLVSELQREGITDDHR